MASLCRSTDYFELVLAKLTFGRLTVFFPQEFKEVPPNQLPNLFIVLEFAYCAISR